MHSFTLGTHSSDWRPIFLRFFCRFFAYQMPLWILVVLKPNHASPENRHFAHKFHCFHQDTVSFISIDICFHISTFFLEQMTSAHSHQTAVLLLQPNSDEFPACYYSRLLEESRSIPVTDNDLSILAITETWDKSDDPPLIINGPAPPGYRTLG